MGSIFLYSLVAGSQRQPARRCHGDAVSAEPEAPASSATCSAVCWSGLTIGFVIVFAVHQSRRDQHEPEQHQSGHGHRPRADLAHKPPTCSGAKRAERRRAAERRRRKRGVEKGPSRVERVLGKGSARITFLVGIVLTLPGVSYLAALHELDQLNYGTVPTILVILGFNIMLLIVLEIPLVGYVLAPERTIVAVQDFRGLAEQERPQGRDLRGRRTWRAADRPRRRDRVPHLSLDRRLYSGGTSTSAIPNASDSCVGKVGVQERSTDRNDSGSESTMPTSTSPTILPPTGPRRSPSWRASASLRT